MTKKITLAVVLLVGLGLCVLSEVFSHNPPIEVLLKFGGLIVLCGGAIALSQTNPHEGDSYTP